MSEKYLQRADAPFADGVWQQIDGTVVGAAKSQLAARRLLAAEGPYGLGLKNLPATRDVVETKSDLADVTLTGAWATPLVEIASSFTLTVRDVAAFEERGMPLNLGGAAAAAIACARQEDDLLLNGSKKFGTEGLLTAKGAQTAKLRAWKQVGEAVEDIIAAVTKLDAPGFHGPYALALSPDRYNLLFRRYTQGDTTEIEHLRTLITDGIVKAPAIGSGGVLIASGKQFASIVIGQDLMTAYVGPAGAQYSFLVSESVALPLLQPETVCVLKAE